MRLRAAGQPVLPTHLLPDEAPSDQFPFALLTPKQHTRFLNSSYSHLPKHGPLEGSPYVEISAIDAATLDVVEGDCLKVWNHRGALELPAAYQRTSAAGGGCRAVGVVGAAAIRTATSPTRSPTTRSPTGAGALRSGTLPSPSNRSR